LSEVFGGNRHGGQRQSASKEAWSFPTRKDLPPPDIGPIPTLIEADFLEEDDQADTPPSHAEVPKHYDDPIEEALFGAAPELDESIRAKLGESEQGAPESEDGEATSTGLRPNPSRRKRQNRSRRRKNFRERPTSPDSTNPESGGTGDVPSSDT
jgi:hypothetical protein